MCRCCCCWSICCCLSRKSRQSFPINEKKAADRSSDVLTEVNKVIVRPVQSVRLPKQTVKKPSTTKQKIEEKSLQSRTPLETLFQKVKPPPISSSPVPISIHSVVDDKRVGVGAEDVQASTASDWPSTTMSDRSQEKKLPPVFSQVLGAHLARENLSKNKPQGTRKSKLVLQNVRKMIDDQHSQADRPAESAQL